MCIYRKNVSVTPLELTQVEKEELYNQYVEFVAELSVEYPNSDIFINPLDTFKDEYFMEPEDYREFLVDLATSYIVVEPGIYGGLRGGR